MLTATLLEKLQNFFATGNNLYLVIAIGVAVIALIVIVAVSSPKRKKKEEGKSADAARSETQIIENANGAEPVAEVAAETAPAALSETEETKREDAVIAVTVLEEQPAEEESENRKTTPKNAEAAAPEENAPKAAASKKPTAVKTELPTEDAAENVASEKMLADKQKKTEPKSAAKTEVKKPAVKKAEKQQVEIEVPEEDGDALGLTEEDGRETRPGTVEIYKDAKGEFHFRFRAMNGSIVGHSQAYKSKDGCKNGIRSVIATCAEAEIADTTKKDSEYLPTIGKAVFEIYKDNGGKYRFRLTAKNAMNILASQGYTSKANCVNGAESIVRMSVNHTVNDITLKKKA